MKPVIMRMVVDLPAPFGPRKPSTSPRSTVNEISSTARFAPKDFTRFSILIIDCLKWGQAIWPNCLTLFRSARFSHKPKEQNHAVTRQIFRRRAVGAASHPGCRQRGGAEVSDQAGAHPRAVRAGRRLGLHRALHRAAPDR